MSGGPLVLDRVSSTPLCRFSLLLRSAWPKETDSLTSVALKAVAQIKSYGRSAKTRLRHEGNLKAHAALANRCLSYLLKVLQSPRMVGMPVLDNTFLEYTVQYWVEHASLAKHDFSILKQDASLFKADFDECERRLTMYKTKTGPLGDVSKIFSIFHVTAKWGVPSFVLDEMQARIRPRNVEDSAHYCTGFDDTQYEASDGRTRLKVAAYAGQIDVMAVFFGRAVPGIVLKKRVLNNAASNNHGREMLALLLYLKGDQIQITEEVVKTAAGNWLTRDNVMGILLEQQVDKNHITEDVVKTTAYNPRHRKEIMTLLLNRYRGQIHTTDDVI